MIFRILLAVSWLAFASTPAIAQQHPPPDEPAGQTPFDPLSLNIRMISNAVHPPSGLVKQQWVLTHYRLGKFTTQAPRAAIIENDAHQRLLILSATDDGGVVVYQLGDLPADVSKRLPHVLSCAQSRQCHLRRNDPSGELGCLALCLLEHLTE